MFSPVELDLERGWPGRLDGDRVIQLAAQTLQAFFTGGGVAREHAVYPLADVVFRPPVLHPPSIRIFDDENDFRFANPAAIVAHDAEIRVSAEVWRHQRDAAVIGLDGAIGGFTRLVEWTAPDLPGEKSRDFALALGPVVTTPDEAIPPGDWEQRVALAAANTKLYPGDLIVGYTTPAIAA